MKAHPLFDCRTWAALAIALAAGAISEPDAEDWPQFRGPMGNGFSAESQVPISWTEQSNLVWKVPVAGSGWAQPIIVSNTIYLVSATSDQPIRPKDYASGVSDPHTIGGAGIPAPDVRIHWRLSALDLRTGQTKWERPLLAAKPKYAIHPSNTYASETPAADEQGIYVFLGNPGLAAALNHEGQLLWTRELGACRMQENYGTGASPRLYRGMLYIQCFDEDRAFIACLNGRDGTEKWRVTRSNRGSCWNTPLLWQTKTGPQLVVYSQKLMTGLDPLSGEELWRFSGDMPAMTSACADAERLYFGCRDPYKGGPLRALAFKRFPDAPSHARAPLLPEAWSAQGAAPGMPSPVVSDGFVFALHDAFLTCHDALTGKQHYKERLPGFRSVIASPIAVNGKVLVLDESGEAFWIKASSSFEILGHSRLDDRFWASPAVGNRFLVLRGVNSLYGLQASERAEAE